MKTQSVADTERLWTGIDITDVAMGANGVLASDDDSGMGDTITREGKAEKKGEEEYID